MITTIPVSAGASSSYSAGTGAGQVQKACEIANTTTISTPVDVDLTAVTCLDATTGFAHVRELVVVNLDLTNALTVGDDGVVTNPWSVWCLGTTPRVLVQPGTALRIAKPLGTNGYPVVGASSCKVRINPGAYAIAYQVVIIGD